MGAVLRGAGMMERNYLYHRRPGSLGGTENIEGRTIARNGDH